MTIKTFAAIGLLITLMCGGALAQVDNMGTVDTLTLVVDNYSPNKWVVTANLWNDEEIAAFDIPLKYSAGMAKLLVDSVTYTDTRADYFAQKYTQVDTTGQMMHFGGLAYMGSDKPPLSPGNGKIGQVFISVMGNGEPGAFKVDTVFFQPNNKLMMVDRNAKTIIPVVKIETVSED